MEILLWVESEGVRWKNWATYNGVWNGFMWCSLFGSAVKEKGDWISATSLFWSSFRGSFVFMLFVCKVCVCYLYCRSASIILHYYSLWMLFFWTIKRAFFAFSLIFWKCTYKCSRELFVIMCTLIFEMKTEKHIGVISSSMVSDPHSG